MKRSMILSVMAAAIICVGGCGSSDGIDDGGGKKEPTYPAADPTVTMKQTAMSETSVTVEFTLGASVVSWKYALGEGSFTVVDGTEAAKAKTVTFDNLSPNTTYTVKAEAENAEGKKTALQTLNVRTKTVVDPNALRCVGYIPTWGLWCTETIDWSVLTHLNIAFYYPSADGAMTMPVGESELKGLIAKAHDNGVKILPSIRDCSEQLFSSAEGRAAFAKNIVDHVVKYGMDGVDIDLEKGEAWFWTNYEAFVVELHRLCEAQNLLLTTAVSTWFSDNITNRAFSCFDFINIMSYDLGFANHSPFEGMKTMAEHYRDSRGIAARKIVLGVPFYGYDKNSTSWDTGKFRSITYRELIELDPNASQSDSYDVWVYNGMATMAQKAEWARDWGGVMIWELSQDTPSSSQYSLLKVIKNKLWDGGAAPRPVTN